MGDAGKKRRGDAGTRGRGEGPSLRFATRYAGTWFHASASATRCAGTRPPHRLHARAAADVAAALPHLLQ